MLFIAFKINIDMQTIYAYSYNPAINTGTNTTGTNWRMAYQQPIMLYKGTANTIKIVVFASNQRVVDLTGYDIQIQIVDKETEEHFVTKTADITQPTSGVASVTFSESDLRYLLHRFYHIIARLVNPEDGSSLITGEILYLDDNYGAFTPVTIESAWDYNPTSISTIDGIPEISFTNIEQTPNSFAGSSNYLLRVNAAETSVEFVNSNSITINYNNLINKPNLANVATTGDYFDLLNLPNIPNLLATGNIIPSANVTYSLGNASNQWKDLWVSNSTIYLNNIPLAVDANGNLTVNGNVIANTGNLAFINNSMYNLGGVNIENSDLSHGLTAALTLPSNGNISNPVHLINTYGNVNLTAGANPGALKNWIFSSDGNLTLPGNNASISNNDEFRIWSTNTDITVYRNGQDGYGVKANEISVYANNIKITKTSTSGLELLTGTLSFPDNSTQSTAYRYNAQTSPPTLTQGALWFNSDEGRLYINYNNAWVDASPTEIDPSAIRFNEQNQIELPVGGDISYAPGNISDWQSPAPTGLVEAVDRLAALLKVLNSGVGA